MKTTAHFNFYQKNFQHTNMLLTHNRRSSAGIRKKTLSQKVEVGMNALVFSMITMICLIALFYLAHMNTVATKGYELKNLREERSMLMAENEIWNMKIARSQALQNLQNDPLIATMQTAETPKYIRTDTAVAKK